MKFPDIATGALPMLAQSPLRFLPSGVRSRPDRRWIRRGKAVRRFLPGAPMALEERLVLSAAEFASAQAALEGLAQAMDRDFSRFPVYDDVGSPGNHFHGWAKIGDDFSSVGISG